MCVFCTCINFFAFIDSVINEEYNQYDIKIKVRYLFSKCGNGVSYTSHDGALRSGFYNYGLFYCHCTEKRSKASMYLFRCAVCEWTMRIQLYIIAIAIF
ncbi:MAG TPA: hypothetical protein DG942_03365 [Ruminococcaceae bacterium]|nr:hypothetical protein [Oscillospiraceae bacterium]